MSSQHEVLGPWDGAPSPASKSFTRDSGLSPNLSEADTRDYFLLHPPVPKLYFDIYIYITDSAGTCAAKCLISAVCAVCSCLCADVHLLCMCNSA